MTQNDTLTTRQRSAIAALMSEPTLEAAARAAGVSRKTLYRYLDMPTFRAALKMAQSRVLSEVSARLVSLLNRSLDVLADDLCGQDMSRRSRAAIGILNRFQNLAQYVELEDRVRELESRGLHDT